MKSTKLLAILNKYWTGNQNVAEWSKCIICELCTNFDFNPLIENVCKCENKIHLVCLINSVKNEKCGEICNICNQNTGLVIDPHDRILFPFANIYREPLLTTKYVSIDKSDKSRSLRFACAYAQVDRVRVILNNMSRDEFMHYVDHDADYHGVHSLSKYGKICMKDNPSTNLGSICVDEYNEINEMLASKF